MDDETGPIFEPVTTLVGEQPQAEGDWFIFDQRGQLLTVEGAVPSGLEAPAPLQTELVVGVKGERPVRAGTLARDADPFDDVPEGSTFTDLRSLYGAIDEGDWVLAGRATQLLMWDRDHRFCGRCGKETEQHPTERARTCSCGTMSFPRLSPAVIMLVERDGPNGPEVLLAWGRQFPGRFFSALAGFVEPGESLEECVAREVAEETGIQVTDVRYFNSQPWPFPNSLMIGFTARYAGGEIVIQEEEIVEADWYGPDDLPPVPLGGMSIAGWLIEDWLARVKG